MGWNYDESLRRVREHLAGMGEIDVKPYTREMKLDNLSETVCRDIFGAHIYAEIRNLSTLVSDRVTKTERQELIQATHLYQREVGRIADAVGAERIHFQGGRAHFLIHHPIDDAAGIARKAALLQLVLDRFGVVFNTEFSDLDDVEIRSGSDMGTAIGTRNGTGGDRELLFLGRPANHAAKLLAPDTARRRLTAAIEAELPADLGELVEDDGETFKLVRPTPSRLQELLDKYEIEWSPDASAQRLGDDREMFPAEMAGLWATEFTVKFDDLKYSDSKLVDAATLYGDVSGFTAYIDDADTDDKKREALRAFHAIRLELDRVVKKDYDGVRVQFQGDRIQAIFHLPKGASAAISDRAVRASAAMQSSFEKVLKSELPEIATLGIAIGISRGDTIAARLGVRAHRDRICLGKEVLRAERNEERSAKRETGISGNVHDQLDAVLQEQFAWSDAKGCFIAAGLDHDKITLLEDAKALDAGKAAYLSGSAISTSSTAGRPVQPAPSHGPRS